MGPASILQRVAKGDDTAVDECLTRHGGVVWALARRASPTRSDAEDAVQEIFLEVWRNAGRYDPAVASEASFIAMIARRRLIDRFRRDKRHVPTQTLPTEPASHQAPLPDPLERGEEISRAREGLDRLRPEEKCVLELSIEQGLSHAQIAERMQVALGTVKSHARRGLIRLREILQVETASVGMGERS